MAMKVSEVFVDTLVAAGVQRIYGLTGDSLNGITDAVRRNQQIAWMHVRHEEAAAFAAGAESQLTGEIAVCAGSCGPGNLHLINGLYDCHRSLRLRGNPEKLRRAARAHGSEILYLLGLDAE